MTRDSGGEQPQKTVAELLAEHGGQVGGTRRRRRRADDDADGQPDIGDTAPQAIIDRVQAEGHAPPTRQARRQPEPEEPAPRQPRTPRPRQQDSGALPRPQQDSGQLPRPPAPPQDSGAFPRPNPAQPRQQDSGALPRPKPQDSGALPRPKPQAPAEMTRPSLPHRGRNLVQPGNQEPPNRMPARGRPAPPPPPPGALAARLDGLDEAEPEVAPDPPHPGTGNYPVPPAPPGRRGRRPARRPAPPPEPESHTEQFPAVEETEIGAAPPVEPEPAPDEPPAGLAGWRERRRKAQLEETDVGAMPTVEPGQDGGPPTQGFRPDPADDEDAAPTRYDDFDDDPLRGDDPDADEYGLAGYDEELDADDEPLAEDERLADEEPEADEEASPAKQWLVLAGQLALGVIGGAGVWLGFNWLWTRLPAAALVAALVVTVGLVLIVRKVRRAEDLQTTVLALLVGLVVAVSPAALLLVSR